MWVKSMIFLNVSPDLGCIYVYTLVAWLQLLMWWLKVCAQIPNELKSNFRLFETFPELGKKLI